MARSAPARYKPVARQMVMPLFEPPRTSRPWLEPFVAAVLATHAPGVAIAPLRVSSRMRRSLGSFTPSRRQVTLNARLLALGTDEEVRLVLLHELAHAIAHSRSPRAPSHGRLFREVCDEIGAKASRYVDVSTKGWGERTRFSVRCPDCRAEITRQRRVARARCVCGREVRPGRWQVKALGRDGQVRALGASAPPGARAGPRNGRLRS
jgi:predicted SprT family Zn-dependent metalloprotease